MATQVSGLPEIGLNPAICPENLRDMETSFRYVFNYMLDADENDRNVRDAGRGIIFDFLAKLGQPGKNPHKVLREFAAPTAELFESARNQSQVPARERRYLRDYPARAAGENLPTREWSADIVVLVGAGALRRAGATYNLTPLGRAARAEIHRAERYVADHFFCPVMGVEGHESA